VRLGVTISSSELFNLKSNQAVYFGLSRDKADINVGASIMISFLNIG